MSAAVGEEATTIPASEVRVGDRLRSRDGSEFTVTRIDPKLALRAGMMAFVEDSEKRWFKMPAMSDGEVQLVARGEA